MNGKEIKFDKEHPVDDVGLVKGRIFIEQQPTYQASAHTLAAYAILFSGWLLFLFGFASLFLPALFYSTIKLNPNIQHHLITAPLFIPLMAFSVRFTINNSLSLVKNSLQLFNIYYFKSNGILVELDGIMARADYEIGKAFYDSNKMKRSTLAMDPSN